MGGREAVDAVLRSGVREAVDTVLHSGVREGDSGVREATCLDTFVGRFRLV